MPHQPLDIPRVVVFPPALYLGPLLAGLLIQAVRPTPFLPPPVAPGLGLVFTGSGLLLLVAATRAMRRAGTNVNPNQPATALVTEGPFRFSRNPIYLAFTLLYGGVAGLANALWPALLLPLVLIVLHDGVIAREEQYLERKFGPAYVAYKSRVRRWV